MTEMPAGWKWSTVGDAGRLQLGRQRSPRYHSGPNMRPYLRVANVFEDRIDIRDVKQMDFTPDEFERYRLHEDDVLLNEGQTPELLGRPAIYRGNPPEVCFTNSLIRFQANPDVDPRWALTVFRHHMHSGRFTRESRITTNIAHLSIGRLRRVEFPIPPIEEQRRIVDILEDHLSRLDAARMYLQSVTEHGPIMRGAVYQAAISGCLIPPSASGSERRRETLAVRKAACPPEMKRGRPEPVGPMAVDVPWPHEWPTMSLEELTHPVRTISYGILKPGPNLEGGVPYVRVVNMRNDVLDTATLHRTSPEVAAAYARSVLAERDVLISIRGTYGRVVEVPAELAGANITQDTARLALLPTMLPDFAIIALRSPYVKHLLTRVARGVAVKGVNIRDLRAIPLPLPSIHEQSRIVARVAELESDVRAGEASAAASLARVPRLHRSLLQAAFSGRLAR